MGKRVLRIAVGAAALLVSSVWAQQNVGIGTNTPHPTALLELYSTSKGLLIPRMTQAERDAISSPATGLLIYQTDNTPGFYYWNGTAWIPILSSSSGSGLFWSLTGNSITGTEFLGTTNAQPLVIQVGNQETFRFNPPGASAPAWSIQRGGGDPRGLHAVDLQSARSAPTQVASGDYSVIGGGVDNTASGDLATVGGGAGNTASAYSATVGGGYRNTASGLHATVGGGQGNTASASFATVGGGLGNTASGLYATVGGGLINTASGLHATVGGGWSNTASVDYATVGGGRENTASGSYATVGGGRENTASGDFSAIPGGFYLRVGERSFGFSGQTSAIQTDLSANSNIAAFVDVDLWLYSRDRTQASQLRFYEAQAHISGANYVALRAPTSLSANTTYTLPADLTAGTLVANARILQSDDDGNLSWLSPTALAAATAWALTGNSGTNPAVNFLGTTDAQPLVIRTNNTERVRITATGNVGIGTSAPTERLQVSDGNIAITNTDNTARQLRLYEPSGAGANFTAFQAQAQASDIIYTLPASLTPTSTVAAGILQTDASGNLSWLSPTALAAATAWALTGNSITSAWDGSSGNFLGTTNAQPLVIATTNTTTPQPIQFWTGNTERVRITATGNVGIGTAAPTERLQVSDGNVAITNTDNTARQLRLYEPSGAGANFTAFRAQAQASDIIYTLPASLTPTSTVAAGILQTDASGNLSWLSPTALAAATAWALTGNSGTNPAVNFLGTTDAQPLVIRTNNTERVRVTATGNVGIGTAAPTERLQVSDGNVAITNTDNTARQLRLYEPSGAGTNFTAFRAQAQASDIIYTLPASLTPTSTVGAGILQTDTSGNLSWLSPAALGGGGAGWALTGNSITSAWNGSSGSFLGTTNAQPLVIATTNTTTPQPIQFWTGNTERMRITATGNVGIGTSAPALRLAIVDAGVGLDRPAANVLALYTNNTERVRITATGNVGIGTAAPTERLQVSDGNVAITNTDNTARQLRLYEPSGAGANFTAFRAQAQASDIIYTLPASLTPTSAVGAGILQTDASGNLSWLSPTALAAATAWALTGNSGTNPAVNFLGTTDAQPLVIRTNNIERVRVTATGNVGIGTAAPTERLQVSDGNVAITNTDNTARQLRLYEPSGAGANFTAFRAQAQASDIIYTLPASLTPTSTVAAGILQTDASGNLSWLSPTALAAATAWALTGNAITSAWNGSSGSFLGTTNAQPLVIATTNTTTPQPIQFWTGNTERMRITATGNVGIGTSAPALRLAIVDAGVGLDRPAANVLALYTNNTERVRITATGNVGIGTAAPTERLQVSDGNVAITNTDNTARQLRLYEPSGAGANFTAFRAQAQASDIIYTLPASLTPTSAVGAGILQTDASGNLSWLSPTALAAATAWALTGNSGTNPAVNFLGTTDAQPLVIRTNNIERVRVTATGNVGIGTAAPTERLQVSDGNVAITNTDNTARQLRLYEPSGAGANFTAFRAQAQASDIIYTLPASLTPTSTVAAGILQTDASGNLSWLSPTALAAATAWALTGNSGTNPAVNFLGTTDAQPLVIRTNNIERVRVTATGNVGIGTAAPTERLQVSDGNVAITNTDNTARQLRLYEPSGAGANFTAFRAQAQASDIIYTLPASLTPTSTVAAGILQTDASGNLSWLTPSALVTGSAWALTGNSITGTEFLGTTNAQPLVIRTNNTERMRVTATGNVGIGTASPTTALHVVAASNPLRLQGVQVSTQDTALVIDANGVITKRSLGDAVKANAWSLTGNSGTSHLNFLGTTDSARLEIRVRNVPAWRAEPVAVGATPNIIGGMGFVTGGAVGATIGGGGATSFYNEVSDNYGTVAGGYRNIVGNQNTNPADAAYAFIGGGAFNFARNAYAAVAGGAENVAWGQYSFIGGGNRNSTASGATGATVVGGYVNVANGAYAAIGGGAGNFAGAYSAIPGGYNLRIGNSSFGFSGQSSGLVTDLTTYSNIAVFVDVDLWLYSRDRTQASQLRFYEAQAHGSGANYVALRAPTSLSANTTYTLPASLTPTSTVGAGILQTDASGNLSWLSPAALVTGSAWALTGNSITSAWNGSSGNFLGTTNAQPLVIATTNTTTPQPIQIWVGNQETFRFNPPGASAPAWSIQRGGGDPRGLHAVDLQSARSAPTQVASGDYSVIGGGVDNTASGGYATVGGGLQNTASGKYATVGGGGGNTASGGGATVSGGEHNTASGDYATVGGGDHNTASGLVATVGGGGWNTASGQYATVGGGFQNTASGDYSAIPGGYNLRVGTRSFGFSGQTSTTQTDLSANSNIAAFVDVDLWLYSRDRTQASQLRLYEAQAHGSGANYVALRAPTSLSANTTYTLPASDGSPGQVLTTDGNGQLSWSWNSGGTIFVRKTANESVTNSTTPQADDHLYATLPANSIWEVEILLRTQSAGGDANNGGIQVQLNASTGTSMQVYVEIKKGGSGSDLNHHWHYGWITAPNTSVGYNPIPGTTPIGAVKLKGLVIVGSTGGTLQLYWAQNAANGNATTVYANSYMKLTRIQ